MSENPLDIDELTRAVQAVFDDFTRAAETLAENLAEALTKVIEVQAQQIAALKKEREDLWDEIRAYQRARELR